MAYPAQNRFREIAREEEITQSELLDRMCDLYQLDDITLLLERLSEKRKRGFDLVQVKQLRVLLSHLRSIVAHIEKF